MVSTPPVWSAGTDNPKVLCDDNRLPICGRQDVLWPPDQARMTPIWAGLIPCRYKTRIQSRTTGDPAASPRNLRA